MGSDIQLGNVFCLSTLPEAGSWHRLPGTLVRHGTDSPWRAVPCYLSRRSPASARRRRINHQLATSETSLLNVSHLSSVLCPLSSVLWLFPRVAISRI